MVKRPPSGDIKFTASRLQPTNTRIVLTCAAQLCVLWKVLNVRHNTRNLGGAGVIKERIGHYTSSVFKAFPRCYFKQIRVNVIFIQIYLPPIGLVSYVTFLKITGDHFYHLMTLGSLKM
jgi:hypothetical protein